MSIAVACAGSQIDQITTARKAQLRWAERPEAVERQGLDLATSFAPSLLADVGPFASLVRGADEAVTLRPVLFFLVQLLYHSIQSNLLFPISRDHLKSACPKSAIPFYRERHARLPPGPAISNFLHPFNNHRVHLSTTIRHMNACYSP